jgi:hypothetical protein
MTKNEIILLDRGCKNSSYVVEPENFGFIGKETFHRFGKKLLREVAKNLNLVKGRYEIRSNRGGIAVSGEITLHSENIYIQLSKSITRNDMCILVRKVRGMKDYVGGANQYYSFNQLEKQGVEGLSDFARLVMGDKSFMSV